MSWEADKAQIEYRLEVLDDYIKILEYTTEKQTDKINGQLENLKEDLETLQSKFEHLHDDLMTEIKIQVKYQLSLKSLRNKP
jgi:chromosome segregation ATPase